MPDFGKVGRAATEEQLQQVKGSITDAKQGGGFGLADDKGNAVKADLGSTIGIHGDSNITTAVSENGKSIDIKLNNQVDLGDDGSIKAGGVTIDSKGIDAGGKNITNVASGIVNKDDSDNNNAANIGDVKTLAGEAAKTEIGKLGSRDFAGDDGETVSRGLGESMKLSGGADTSKLTNGNIGVVKNADGDGLDIKLSSELTGLTSVITGNTTMSSDGIKITSAGEGTHAVEITNSNVSMGGQQIHDVAPGTSDTDAVNVSQLKGLVSGVDGAVNRLNNRLNRVGAGAAALAALHPLDFNPEEKWNFAAGFGHYVNANAGAIGAFYQPNEDTLFSLGGSWGGGENMVNAGVSIRLGHGNSIIGSRTVMAREIMALKQQVEAQSLKLKENEDLKARLAKQDQEIAELKAMVLKLAAKG
ncbi:YadA-like family protein [uncultured Dialister sp.]|uniref:YadA-like family protein n=1 Tax=Dialister succinatiphilus TaxID=487173 RepID=UPI00266F116D|nr:YadA-like family protein [uncultured Dialister sp.]